MTDFQQFPNSFGRPDTILAADYTPGDGVLVVNELPIGVAATGPIFQVKVGPTLYKVTDLGAPPYLIWSVPDGAVEGTADVFHLAGSPLYLELTRGAIEALRAPTFITRSDETDRMPNSSPLEDVSLGELGTRLHSSLTDIDANQHHPRSHSHSSGPDGTVLNPYRLSVSQTFTLAGIISPSQITANTDNYTPTGNADSTVWRVSTDASRNLTGIYSAQTDGQVIVLINVGANNLVLKHDATSTATNRFLCPGSADYTLGPNAIAILIYDTTSGRWRVK